MTLEYAYEILGLNSDASQDEVKKAYRELVKVYHPDKNTAANATVMFRLIQDAWNCLQPTFKEEIIHPTDDAETYYNRGVEKFNLGQYESAITDFDLVIRLTSDDEVAYIAYNYRGSAKKLLGQREAALADFDEAIRLKPDYVEVYNNRGVVKSELGLYFNAIADFDTVISLEPDYAYAYNNRGRAKSNLQDHFAAITDFDTAIRLKPDYIEAYKNRGEY